LTFSPTNESVTASSSYLNIVPSPEEQHVLDNAKALLTNVPAILGSKITQLIPSGDSPFAQAMQWLLGSLEQQCSTTYHGTTDAPGVITFGVGLRLDNAPTHACPIRRLNEAYPDLKLNYAVLSTTLNRPQPPLS